MDPIVTAALVTGAFGATATAFQTLRMKRETKALRADVATNHGMRPGEYLEKIHAEVANIKSLVVQSALHTASLADQLADHTISDAVNFEELRALAVEACRRPKSN